MRYQPKTPVISLGEGFYDAVAPAVFPRRVLRFRNDAAAKQVGLDELTRDAWEAHFAKFEPLPANLPEPLALRYHGHQFGVYNSRLGDGRGFLFAQLKDDRGRVLDLGTKGSGRTPYSRGADGRLTLKGGVREILATSMLEALGVDTSRSFSLFETFEGLHRGDEPSPTRSSVLVRLSHSHVRFGTFQRFAFEKDAVRMKKLVDYVLEHLLPEAASAKDPVAALLGETMRRHARTAAQWMVAGFVHGVLNTDNMNITGESFDYGPWRFLPTYDPAFVAAYFDESGLYAFGRQPGTVLWNLNRLAEALRTVEPQLAAGGILEAFEGHFVKEVQTAMLRRLGLKSGGPELDDALVAGVFEFLEASKLGFDRFFFDAFGGAPKGEAYAGPGFVALGRCLEVFEPRAAGARGHVYFTRDAPVTMVVDEVERVWAAIAEADDWGPLTEKIAAVGLMGEALA